MTLTSLAARVGLDVHAPDRPGHEVRGGRRVEARAERLAGLAESVAAGDYAVAPNEVARAILRHRRRFWRV